MSLHAGALVRAVLAALFVVTLELAGRASAAPVDLETALANLDRLTPVRRGLRSVGPLAASAVAADQPDEIFAQGFDNANSQCIMPTDCPATGSECVLKACTEGLCAASPAPPGTTCTGGVCDGLGACIAFTYYGWPDPFASTTSVGNGSVLAYRISIPNATTLDKFGIYTTSSSGDWKLALYTDSSNQPGALVADMDTHASITSAGDQQADIADVPLAAGAYWIAYRSAPSLAMGYSGASQTATLCIRNVSIPSLDTAWPSTFGTANCSTSGILNVYVVAHD